MKAIDGVLGLAIGDAMGVPIEFTDRDTLLNKPVTKMLGYGNYNVPKGTWSDDTALTLATIDSLYQKKDIDYNDMMKKFCDWINKAMYTGTKEIFDIGTTTKFALMKYYNDHIEPLKCGSTDVNENGNGSLMRMFPIAYYCYKNGFSDQKIEYLSITTSSLTHAHPISTLGCYIYIKYIIHLLEGNDKITSYIMLRHIDYQMFTKDTIKKYHRILEDDITNLSIDKIRSSGYIVDTLEASLWSIMNTNSYEEAVIVAINLGGDTDTIGAITGSIAGLIYGKDTIPERWTKYLNNYTYLTKMVSKWEASLKKL